MSDKDTRPGCSAPQSQRDARHPSSLEQRRRRRRRLAPFARLDLDKHNRLAIARNDVNSPPRRRCRRKGYVDAEAHRQDLRLYRVCLASDATAKSNGGQGQERTKRERGGRTSLFVNTSLGQRFQTPTRRICLFARQHERRRAPRSSRAEEERPAAGMRR